MVLGEQISPCAPRTQHITQVSPSGFNGAPRAPVTRAVGFDFDGTVSDNRGFKANGVHYPIYSHALAAVW